MASIEKTAYPRFTKEILEEEGLKALFQPTDEELKMDASARSNPGRPADLFDPIENTPVFRTHHWDE